MKLRVLRFLFLALAVAGAGYLIYRGYDLWQTHQKRKALFVYLTQKSPVLKKIPGDAIAYLNLFDFKRVYESLEGTLFSDVLNHWFDTGMAAKEKPNSLRGGMVEKTLLNILGQEFALAAVPGKERPLEIVAVSRLAPGSDFLLNLALASSHHSTKTEYKDWIVYSFPLKNLGWQQIYVSVDDHFAFAATDFSRMQQILKGENCSPNFLSNLSVQAIPENTFLFMRAENPAISADFYGDGHYYHIEAAAATLRGQPPEIQDPPGEVLRLATNLPQIVGAPPTSYVLALNDDNPIGTVFLQAPAQSNAIQPLTLQVGFQRGPIERFHQKIQNKDWSDFPNSAELYFLSCIRKISGGINSNQHDLTFEID